MKIILFDTNILYGLYRNFVRGEKLTSSLIPISYKHQFFVSSYIISELLQKIGEKENHVTSRKEFEQFRSIILFEIVESDPLDERIHKFVFDINDAQILQDAIDIDADILLTNNLKDFKIDLIEETFGILVTNRLPDL